MHNFIPIFFSITCILIGRTSSTPLQDVALTFIHREFYSSFTLFLIVDDKKANPGVTRCLISVPPTVDYVANVIKKINNKSFAVIGGSGLSSEQQQRHLNIIKATEILLYLELNNFPGHKNLTEHLQKWKFLPVWSSRAVIFVIIEKAVDLLKTAQDVAEQLWNTARAGNVVILAGNQRETSLFTWTPFQQPCQVQVYQTISYQKYLTNSSERLIQENNYSNLNQCQLVAATAVIEPFVFAPNATGFYTRGFEVKIFLTLAKYLNFSYSFVEAKPGESAWVTLANGVPAGHLARLVWNEADVLFHALTPTNERCRYSEPTDSHYIHEMAWVAPLPERVANWKSVYLVFDFTTWLLTVSVFLTAAWIFHLLSPLGKQEATLTSFVTSLNCPGHCPTNGNSLRFYLYFHFFFALNISAAYQSGLFTVMANGLAATPIETIQELIWSKYHVNIFPSGVPVLVAGIPDLYKYMTDHKLISFSEDAVGILREIAFQARTVSLLSDVVIKYQANLRFSGKYRQKYVRILKERMNGFHPTFFLTMGHPIKPHLQIVMRRLIEHGWIERFVTDEMDNAAISMKFSESEKLDAEVEYYHAISHKLNMDQLLGAFLIVTTLLLFSVMVFTGEILLHKIRSASK